MPAGDVAVGQLVNMLAFASQASGVSVADDCVTLFNEMKLKHTMKYIVYKMNDGMTEIQVNISCTCSL